MGGAISANAELLTAPTSEIIEPRLGMTAAKITRIKSDFGVKNIREKRELRKKGTFDRKDNGE